MADADPDVNVEASSSASQSRNSPYRRKKPSTELKVELQSLNDRLANYIDRVQDLESENRLIKLQMNTSQDTHFREVTSLRNSYQNELSETRKILDETAKEKARLQLDAGRAKAKLEEFMPKFDKAKSDLERALEGKKDVVTERDKLSKQVEGLNLQIDAELLARTVLENRNMTLKEELSFKQQMYEREMTEVRSNKQVEISEIDGRLQEQYQARLQSTLQELRVQYKSQIQQSRDEVEVLYHNKVKDLQYQIEKHLNSATSLEEKLISARNRLKDATLKLSELELDNSRMKERMGLLERNLETKRQAHATAVQDAIHSCQGEISRLREEMAIQLQEYQDLMDIRTALDMEISAYRKLLEGEETRMNLTREPDNPGSRRLLRKERLVNKVLTENAYYQNLRNVNNK